jgi:LysM repeat protein
MDGRRGNPARLLAPIALVAFVLVLLIVIASSDTSEDSGDSGDRVSQQQEGGTTTTPGDSLTEPRASSTFYTVKTGDTLGGIAETVGVPVTRLQELNPELDPQALVSGQKLRLRE